MAGCGEVGDGQVVWLVRGEGRLQKGRGEGVLCCGRWAQPGSGGGLGRRVLLGGAVCVAGSRGGRIPPGSFSRPGALVRIQNSNCHSVRAP